MDATPRTYEPRVQAVFSNRAELPDVGALGEPEGVARGIAETRVYPVRAWRRRLGELDTPSNQLLVRALAVVGGEEQGLGEALGHQPADLTRGGLVQCR